jgi:hypothetical protein
MKTQTSNIEEKKGDTNSDLHMTEFRQTSAIRVEPEEDRDIYNRVSRKCQTPRGHVRCSSAESIPPSLRNLLTKLEYISMIQRDQKPCFSDMTFVHSRSWFGSCKRLLAGENRKNLLFEIEQIIDRTILAIEEYTNKDYVNLLLENLCKTKNGIENLIITYKDNPDTVSNLKVHVINIDLTLKKHGLKITNNPQFDINIDDPTTGDYCTSKTINEDIHSVEHRPSFPQCGSRSIHSRSNTSNEILTSPPIQMKEKSSSDGRNQEHSQSFTRKRSPKDYIEKHILSSSLETFQ